MAEFDINKMDHLKAIEEIILECNNCIKTVCHRMLDHECLPVFEFNEHENVDISVLVVSYHLIAVGKGLRD